MDGLFILINSIMLVLGGIYWMFEDLLIGGASILFTGLAGVVLSVIKFRKI